MLALFSLRLALGMLLALLVLRPAQINPRYYRTHFLTVLALSGLGLVLIHLNHDHGPPWSLYVALGLAFLGAVSWSAEGAPGGQTLIVLTLLALAASLAPAQESWRTMPRELHQGMGWQVADDLATSALLGSALSAMLLGHMYLMAPTMSLRPLYHLMILLFLALAARAGLAGFAVWSWTQHVQRVSLADVAVLWLPVRWILGLLVPAGLTWMAWRTTRLRNTQSSTGILYIVVVFVFLGELTALLLLNQTGFFL